MWVLDVIDRRAEAAAVNGMAGGSQHGIARSPSHARGGPEGAGNTVEGLTQTTELTQVQLRSTSQ
jgi:hypothetical protein